MDFKEVGRGGTDIVSGALKDNVRSFPEKPSDDPRDIPCVRLTGEQVLEITSDDYALKLFYLTRIKPLSIEDIKAKEPESEPGEASAVIQRFVNVELLEVLPDGKVYSKFPHNYVNFTDHQYDEEFESDKETRVFKLMKEKAGDKEFWRTNAYFSEDGYFTEEQTMFIKKSLQDIKFYIKKVVQANNEAGIVENLTFRRHKFYDLILPTFALLISFFILVSHGQSIAANDPGIIGGRELEQWTINPLSVQEIAESIDWSKAVYYNEYLQNTLVLDGNDPGRAAPQGLINAAAFDVVKNFDFSKYLRNSEVQLPLATGNFSAAEQRATCPIQLANASGSLQRVSLPCLSDIKFATKTVCDQFGQVEYCDIADRATAVWGNTEK